MNIELSDLNQTLIDSITNNEFDKNTRKQILDHIEDEQHYDFACEIFNQTSEIYFKLGFQVAKSL